MGADEIRGDLAKGYMRQQANVNLNTNVGAYDFLLDLLYNLSESTAEGVLQCKDDKGLMHLFLTDHTKKAYEQIREAADEGNAIALYMMAAYFSQGYGVQPINEQKAIAYFKKSYEAGYPVAGYDVAASLPDGSPEQDEIRNNAKDNILELANEGDACAQNNLGLMYSYGRGVELSYEKAVEWYLKAAEQGAASAQGLLGVMYANGTGVEQSYKKAAEWFLKAAKQGLADAQCNLGWMYVNGLV